jgi:hypothetical protein
MLKCSHIICRVNDLAAVVRDYESLGFVMEWGSEPKRAQNALLWFEQGPFIEFFQIPKPYTYLSIPLALMYGRAAGKLWSYWSGATEGWCDIALEPQCANGSEGSDACGNRRELQRIRREINHREIMASRVIRGRRVRPDGTKVRYSLFAPDPVELPFIVSHYAPPQRPKRIRHPNGASGVTWVKVGATKKLIHKFQTLISTEQWLRIQPALQTGVFEVGLSGLKELPKAELLHGAVFSIAINESENKEEKK